MSMTLMVGSIELNSLKKLITASMSKTPQIPSYCITFTGPDMGPIFRFYSLYPIFAANSK